MKSTIFIKHTGRDLMLFFSFFRQGVEAQLSCLSILAKANMLKQLKLCFRPGSACAGATERAFCKGRRPSEKSFRRPTCHAYDYAALIVPTAVCICIGMHAVKRRNRTHEIHNLHKTHRPIFAKCFLRRQGARPEAQLSCLSILAKANMLKQLKLCFRPGLCLRRSDGKGILQGRRPSEKEFQTAYVPCVRLRCANRTYGGLYLHRYARRETA